MSDAIVEVKHLKKYFQVKNGLLHAVDDVNFVIPKGTTMGLVGESGCGKSVSIQTVMGLLPMPPARIKEGHIYYEGKDLTTLTDKQMENYRGKEFSMIFQDPMTFLNPVLTIGKQIRETLLNHNPKMTKKEANERAIELMRQVGIPAPEKRINQYPFEFSGGMRQRIVIAIALANKPKLIIADEPTTALDVTIQAQVLELMKDLNKKNNTTTILITHDLGVVAEMCDEVAIVYAGEIVEIGSLRDIFKNPCHPYTNGLFGALPKLDEEVEWLSPIEGLPPDPTALPQGCKFHPRCPKATEKCRCGNVELTEIALGHMCRCIYAQKEGTNV